MKFVKVKKEDLMCGHVVFVLPSAAAKKINKFNTNKVDKNPFWKGWVVKTNPKKCVIQALEDHQVGNQKIVTYKQYGVPYECIYKQEVTAPETIPLPQIKAAAPKMTAADICKVQPMMGPVPDIFKGPIDKVVSVKSMEEINKFLSNIDPMKDLPNDVHPVKPMTPPVEQNPTYLLPLGKAVLFDLPKEVAIKSESAPTYFPPNSGYLEFKEFTSHEDVKNYIDQQGKVKAAHVEHHLPSGTTIKVKQMMQKFVDAINLLKLSKDNDKTTPSSSLPENMVDHTNEKIVPSFGTSQIDLVEQVNYINEQFAKSIGIPKHMLVPVVDEKDLKSPKVSLQSLFTEDAGCTVTVGTGSQQLPGVHVYGITGQKIKSVRKMTDEELTKTGWIPGIDQATVLELDNGIVLFAADPSKSVPMDFFIGNQNKKIEVP